MEYIYEDEPLAVTIIKTIHTGDIPSMKQLLAENPGLASVRIVRRGDNNEGNSCGESRPLLHILTDWPGRYPNGAATVRTLVEFGAEVNARFTGPHTETALHWASSCDDIEVIDALLDAGADIEAPGAVIAGGTPLDDAVAFAQWRAANRLVERGAQLTLWHAAALGRMEVIEDFFDGRTTLSESYPWGAGSPSPLNKITVAFWCACYGNQRHVAKYLLEKGAELNWISTWDQLTPLDAAQHSSALELVQWLRSQGAKSGSEL